MIDAARIFAGLVIVGVAIPSNKPLRAWHIFALGVASALTVPAVHNLIDGWIA